LFRLPAFSAALAAYAIATFAGFGILLFISQFLQGVRGLSPLAAGIALMPISLSFIVGSFLSPVLGRRVGAAALMGIGMMVAVVGFLLLAWIDTDSGIAIVVAACVLYSLGLAPLFTLTTAMIVGAAPPERAGAAAYRSAMATTIPAGLPANVSTLARGTLGGAIALAKSLPSATAATLVRAAQSAFCHSLDATALSGAVI